MPDLLSVRSASSETTNVRFGKATPGEWRCNSAQAFASSLAAIRMTILMAILLPDSTRSELGKQNLEQQTQEHEAKLATLCILTAEARAELDRGLGIRVTSRKQLDNLLK